MHPDDDIGYASDLWDFAEMSREELQGKVLELLTLVETSRELLRAKDPTDMARRVLLSALGVLGASSAFVLRLDRGQESLVLLQEVGLETQEEVRLRISPGLRAHFESTSPRPFRVDDQAAPGPAQEFLAAHAGELRRLGTALICPLVGRRGLAGFLVLGRRLLAEGYSASDIDLFASLAEFYTLALERVSQTLPATDVPPDALHSTNTQEALAALRERHPPLREIRGESAAILDLFHDLVRFADSRATILIQGESGTGKELVAKAIHLLSRRRNGPLEVVDCSSIPRELIESELFGHVRGAFTGAVRDRKGAFDLAHTGTLFLDEIGDMTLASQTRLLRALQEGKFRPVGGESTHAVDVRVIAATNVDLREAVTQGSFRKDLFYRIQVFPLQLPPLRERGGAIEVLTRSFLQRFFADYGLGEPQIEPEVFGKLAQHDFPGNVRELQNMVEALAIRSRDAGIVQVRHLDEVFSRQRIGQTTPTPRPPIASAEPTVPESSTGHQVIDAWRTAGFNLLEASRQLKARRLEGQPVAVTDRVQMNHYLDGEILRYLESGDVGQWLSELVDQHPQAHRALRRVRRFLAELAAALENPTDELLPRLPDEYRKALARVQSAGPDRVRQALSALEG